MKHIKGYIKLNESDGGGEEWREEVVQLIYRALLRYNDDWNTVRRHGFTNIEVWGAAARQKGQQRFHINNLESIPVVIEPMAVIKPNLVEWDEEYDPLLMIGVMDIASIVESIDVTVYCKYTSPAPQAEGWSYTSKQTFNYKISTILKQYDGELEDSLYRFISLKYWRFDLTLYEGFREAFNSLIKYMHNRGK